MESLIVYSGPKFDPLNFAEKFTPSIEEDDRSVLFCDLSDIIWKVKNWKENLPRVKPFYAVKSNRDPLVLKLMSNLEAGFDCASKEEIECVKKEGVNINSEIIYANTVKYTSHLKYAQDQNVNLMTFDRMSELEKIKKYHPEAKILLRILRCPKGYVSDSGEKFGCDADLEGPELLKAAKELNLNLIGIAFHMRGGPQPETFVNAIEKAVVLFEMGKSLGFDMKMLDIGGGFPAEREADLSPFGEAINPLLEKYFNDPEIEIISEPGRYISGSSGTLFTTVQSKRSIGNDHDKKMDYFVNDGIYNSLRYWVSMYDGINLGGFKRNSKIKTDPEKFPTTIYGSTCMTVDVIAKNTPMEELDVGDLIYFQNIGAYSTAMNSEFNGFPGATTKYFVHLDDLHLVESITNLPITFAK